MADRNHDIEKYLRGELSPAEMHALEKRALDDPFLADALEGASHISADQFQEDVNILSKHLEERVVSKKIVPLWVKISRIAAIFLAVVLSTFVVIDVLKKDKPSQLALNKQQPSTESKTPQADSINEQKTEPAANEPKQEPLALNNGSESKPKVSEEHIASGPKDSKAKDELKQDLIAEKPQVQQDVVAETEIAEVVAEDDLRKRIAQSEAKEAPSVVQKKIEIADSIKTGAALRKLEPSAATRAADKDKSRNVHIIRGKVTDADDGKGVPGVNVTIKGTNIGTVTNAEGYYQLSTDDRNKDLVFSFIGYESTEVNTQNNEEVNIALSQDVAQLSEVVVVGYAPYGEAKSEEKISTFEMAAPAGGRKAFKQYLEQNIRYPEQALANNVEGKVTVQFTVESSGRLSNFRVIKGIGYGCEEEVIRLIKQGPQWTPTKRDTVPLRDRVKVRLKFSLPKK